MSEGRIIKALSGFYYVDNQKTIVQCKARGKFRVEGKTPLVGDFVTYSKEEGSDGYLLDIKPRKNSLVRPPIANVDQALLVFSRKEPDFSTTLLDKFLLVIEHYNIQPIICVSKMDVESDDDIHIKLKEYKDAGYTVIETSSKEKLGLENIKKIFKDKVTVITGQSGVGKSSLLNALDISLNLETNQISKALGRGKHTTRHVELIKMYEGLVADTPGFSNLELEMEPEEAAISYHDFKELANSCKFKGCLHDSEPGCAIKKAVSEGKISKERYEHYLEYLKEVKYKKEHKYG
ncbi:MAG: ribosome small subunit-dependent GTPase A [Thomasclavelia sp.]|jgi:ribosome biogenesis GTPase|nr:ribosome small subunit-dependent GTPase A [Thomasclavelia sp.]